MHKGAPRQLAHSRAVPDMTASAQVLAKKTSHLTASRRELPLPARNSYWSARKRSRNGMPSPGRMGSGRGTAEIK